MEAKPITLYNAIVTNIYKIQTYRKNIARNLVVSLPLHLDLDI